jgi:hypothetical protein
VTPLASFNSLPSPREASSVCVECKNRAYLCAPYSSSRRIASAEETLTWLEEVFEAAEVAVGVPMRFEKAAVMDSRAAETVAVILASWIEVVG